MSNWKDEYSARTNGGASGFVPLTETMMLDRLDKIIELLTKVEHAKPLTEQETRELAAVQKAQYNREHADELYREHLAYSVQRNAWVERDSGKAVNFTQYGWVTRDE